MSDRLGWVLISAGGLFAAALTWALWHYGATESWALYGLFLLVLPPALMACGTACKPLSGPRILGVTFVGCFLLVQTALRSTLLGQGYVLASLGWLALYLGFVFASQSRGAAQGLAAFLILLGALEAVYGLTQMIGGNLVTGTLINRNHFAGLLNMILPLAIGGLFASFLRRKAGHSPKSETYAWTWMVLLCSSFMGLVILLSLSRGGTLALVSTLTFMSLLLALGRRRGSGNDLSGLVVALLLITVLGLGLAVGMEALFERFGRLEEGAKNRVSVARDSLQLIKDHPVIGVGPGMYRWRFRPYQTDHLGARYDHAHNDYLESAAEWGVPAALLFWGFILRRFYRSAYLFFLLRDPWRRGVALGCAGAIFSILVHSLVDFNLQIPANLMVFGMILGLAWSLEPSASGVKTIWIRAVLALFLLFAGWRVADPWRAAWIAHTRPTVEGLHMAAQVDPEASVFPFRLGLAYRDLPEIQDLARSRDYLERATLLNPYNWRYRRELAQLYELSDLTAEAEQAFLAAVRLSPRSGTYRWRLANFYLRKGALEQAVAQLEVALIADQTLFEPAFGMLRKAGGTYEQIDRVWPEDPPARLRLLKLLCQRDGSVSEAADLDFLLALSGRLLDSPQPPTVADGDLCIRHLMKARRFEEARRQWIRFGRRNDLQDVDFEDQRNYVWNGKFETLVTQATLGWRLRGFGGSGGSGGYTVTLAEGEGAEDSTALRIDFDGTQNPNFSGVEQQMVVDPSRTYQLSYRIRSQELTTDQGIFLEILDGSDHRVVLTTVPTLATTPWTTYTRLLEVTESHSLLLRLRRRPSLRIDNLLRGTLWLDSVSIGAPKS
jgi:putative inorganic carbon (HCO3(-)) transporter